MRASMRADGMTCCSRHIPVVTVGLISTERNEGGPHTDVVAVETKGMTATRGLTELLWPPEQTSVTERLVKQGENGGNIHRPPLSYDKAFIESTGGSDIGNLNWERWVLLECPGPEESCHYFGVVAPLC